jgi:ribosomal protein S18 acetylase RimI-like enzyme
MATDELARAWQAMRQTEFRGTREEPWRFGTVAFTPELPLRHDSNFLIAGELPEGVSARELADDAERLLGGAGLRHRMVVVPSPPGEALVPGFRELGWDVHRHLIMVRRRPPDQPVDTSVVVEVDEPTLRPFREAVTRTYPWGTAEVARQLAEAKRLVRGTTRFLAVVAEGEIVSCADLYLSDGDAQIEDLVTLETFRGRGYARALVVAAAERAERAGADFVFLVADDEDWPKELYQRLGFDPLAPYWKFVRVPG